MSRTLTWNVVISLFCLAAPHWAWAQGSERLLAVERAYDEQQAQDQRIIGGRPARIRDNPWQVALLSARVPVNTQAQFCGGSIVAPRWVITAAHCVDRGTLPSQVAILVGTQSLQSGGRRVEATTIIVHENWTRPTHDFDIALVEAGADLGGTAIAGDTADSELPAALPIRITGWGRTSMSASAGTKILQGVSVPYVTRDVCNGPASYDGAVTGNMICAGQREGGLDACQGDSGGPASAEVGGRRVLVGIVSWGQGCALRDKYGIFTRVASFAAWVAEKTSGAVKW
jgi:secreted trypsin-like serine protease